MHHEWTIRPRRVMRTYLVRLLTRALPYLPHDSEVVILSPDTSTAQRLAEDIKRALDQESRADQRK